LADEDADWLGYRARFSEVYDQDNYSSPLQAFVMRQSHFLLESCLTPRQEFNRVLEVGAGTGEHFGFVKHAFSEYMMTDASASALEVARKKASDSPSSVRFEVQDAADLSYPSQSFDRLIAAHVLEHLVEPHNVIKEWLRLLKPGGVISVLIPTDPGLAWRLGRLLGPRKKAVRQGLPYDYLMAREHVNSCTNLIALLRYYCPEHTESWWPLRVPSVDLNLFVAFTARMPD
jgi:ubiquinone/menaquinone biosynthesis C-methylase UbiE